MSKNDIAGGFFDDSSEEEEEKQEEPMEEVKMVDTNTDYFNMNFKQLCEINDLGGDSRLYDILKQMFKNPNDEDEELTNLFTRPLLTHLTSRIGSKQPINIREPTEG